MADYILSAPLTGTKVEELLLRVQNNQDFTSADKNKLDGLDSTYFFQEDSFIDLPLQSGAPVDTPKNVLYGGAKTTPSGLISVDADGVFTVIKGGPYQLKTRHHVTRTGASGTSETFFWVQVSTDGGTTWANLGNASSIKLDNATDARTFHDFASVFFPTGTKVRARFARSSLGTNFGNLEASAPSAAWQSAGVPPVPSAQLTVYKTSPWNYV